MKIKTANIRMLKSGAESYLESVVVKKTLTFANELFFVFRSAETKKWNVSHYTTGLGVCGRARSVAQAEKDFMKIIEIQSGRLFEAVARGLKDYGPANKLPEVEK